MKEKKIYKKAQLRVVQLSGKSVLLAGSEQVTNSSNAARTDYMTVTNGFSFQ